MNRLIAGIMAKGKFRQVILLIGFISMLAISLSVFAASGTTTTTYPVSPLASISLIQAPNTAGALTQVTFGGLVLNPVTAPAKVYVNYSVEVNGVVAMSSGCAIYHLTGLSYTPCSVTVPYYASANVLLLASYKDGQGHLVAGLIEDPLAEPAWGYR